MSHTSNTIAIIGTSWCFASWNSRTAISPAPHPTSPNPVAHSAADKPTHIA